MAEEPEPLWVAALLLRVPEAFGRYISLHSARPSCDRPYRAVTVSGARGRVQVRSEMEACVDLYRGPRTLGNPPVVGFSLGLCGLPGESPVAGQLSGTPVCH